MSHHLTEEERYLDWLESKIRLLEFENKLLKQSLRDISRQPEGDEQSAQAIAKETLKQFPEVRG